jgi:lipid-A-disaccharide synthase
VTIGIVAGEASGDALAATLIRAVKERVPNARFVGVAGPRMEDAGCEVWYPLETLSVRGFVEVLSRLPQLVALRRALYRRLRAERVPLFIGVDAPDFNLGLERKLKRAGVRSVHFVSPSVWAWRRERLRTIGRSVHRVLALFPFEPPLYESAGIPVTFVGHPLAAEAAALGSRREAREQLKLGAAQPVFALLPGAARPSSTITPSSCCAPPRRCSRRAPMRSSSCRLRRGRRAIVSRPRFIGSASTSCR